MVTQRVEVPDGSVRSMYYSPSLDELGLSYGTDKASNVHNYLSFYERFLSPLKDRGIQLLEFGVGRGASLCMWRDYFRHGSITGVDVDPRCAEYAEGRVEVIIGDQRDKALLDGLSLKKFDIIIDDAGHNPRDQIDCYISLVPRMASGGIYILEDLIDPTAVEFVVGIARDLIGRWPVAGPGPLRVESIHFKRLTSVTILGK